MIRLAALGLFHEANTFAPRMVGLEDMETAGVLRGEEVSAVHRGGTSTMSGYLELDARPGIEVIPLVMTTLVPGGPIIREAFEARANEMVAALRERGPFDGVLVALHGAAVAVGIPDADGYLLRLIRDTVGVGIPVGVSLDLHANISNTMCEAADVVNTYRTNPHVDAKDVALEVGDVIARAATGELRPVTRLAQVPAAINILCQNTDEFPMRELMKAREHTARAPGVLSVSIAQGYPYADVPEMGMSVVVVANGLGDVASKHARQLAAQVWELRDAFDTSAYSPQEAIRIAQQAEAGPVLLLDVGDNIGGGAAGESILLLRAAREAGLGSLLTIVVDADAAQVCHQAGEGAQVELVLGERSEPRVCPLSVRGKVHRLHDGTFTATEAVHAGMSVFDAGLTAAVHLETGQTVILTSRAVMPLTTNQIRVVDLDPGSFRAIVAKGVHSPLAGYGPHISRAVLVDTPGTTAADLRGFDFQNRRRPMFPFEEDTTYVPVR